MRSEAALDLRQWCRNEVYDLKRTRYGFKSSMVHNNNSIGEEGDGKNLLKTASPPP